MGEGFSSAGELLCHSAMREAHAGRCRPGSRGGMQPPEPCPVKDGVLAWRAGRQLLGSVALLEFAHSRL